MEITRLSNKHSMTKKIVLMTQKLVVARVLKAELPKGQ